MKESRTLEFKREVARTFLKTVSAFANFGTGTIMFGVDDEGDVVGVEDPSEVSLSIENSINDSVRPIPRYTLEVIQREKKDIVVLEVFEGSDKPYLYRGKAYRRSGTADVEVDRTELNRLVLEGQNLSFEELPAKNQQLTFETLIAQLEARAEIADVDLDVFKTLRLYSNNEGYNNAAAVLADSNEFTGIDMVRFGKSINEILDRERYIGESALLQLEDALKFYRRYYQYEKIEGMVRVTKQLVPEEAFREAVANALVHRHWDSAANIQISMEQDSVLITSPGGLPADLTFEEYVSGRVSVLRNPILCNVFYRLNYIEMFGTGIERIKAAYSDADVKPSFSATENTISVVLPVVESNRAFSQEELAILDCLRTGRLLSRKEVEDRVGLSQAKTGRLLNELIARGAVSKQAQGRATKYTLA